jgi:hypothetical protein
MRSSGSSLITGLARLIPGFVYDLNMLSNHDGGLKGDKILQDNGYLNQRIGSEKFFGFPGLKIYFSELATHGPNPSSATRSLDQIYDVMARELVKLPS